MRVVEIGLNGFLCTNEEGQSSHSNTSVMWYGEPLTEEWLEKFGLSPDWTWKINEPVRGTIFQDGKAYGWNHNIPLQYVHQLQNLYFALTGEELTIKQ